MPLPSHWGVARHGINVSAPDWVYDAVDVYRKKRDYRSVGETALELIVARLLEEGVEPPSDLIPARRSDTGRRRG